MTWLGRSQGQVFCSFCGKSDRDVDRMLGGPGVYICGRCVDACVKILKPHEGKRVPQFGGWDSCSDSHLLESLAPTERALEAVRGDLQARVDVLRKREVSWEKIGGALGISRQAAWERFS